MGRSEMGQTLSLDRPLTGSQKTLIAAEMLARYRKTPEPIPTHILNSKSSLLHAVAALYGVSHSCLSEAIHVLKYGIPEDIVAIRHGKASIRMMYDDIRRRRRQGAEIITLKTGNRAGPAVKVPDGTTLGALARQAAEMRASDKSVSVVAKRLGLSVRVCAHLIDIVLVAGRKDLTGNDAEIAANALRLS